MASIVAYIELREGVVTRPSRFAVAEARRVADAVGATVCALLTVGPLEQTAIDRLAAEVSAAGADRIFCSSAEVLAGPPLDCTHGPLLAQVAEHLRPLLFLFPAGGAGAELGPPLAVRIGAGYLANASLEVTEEERVAAPPAPRIILRRWRAAHDGQRRIDVADFERPLVASLASGIPPAALGEAYAEVEMLPCPEVASAAPRLLAVTPDPESAAELCSALVWVATRDADTVQAALTTDLPAAAAVAEAGAGSTTPACPAEIYLSATAAGEAVLASAAPATLHARLPAQPEAAE